MTRPSGAIALPRPLLQWLDRVVTAFLTPPGRAPIDFSAPAGEPALMSPHSMSWRVFKNPIAVFVGGMTAVLLELAEPRVRDGIWNHSDFRQDPLARLKRTGLAAMVTVYGPRSTAETMIASVVALHEGVRGTTDDGDRYYANDPDLLDWVHATANFGFMEAYHALVRPLTTTERDGFLSENQTGARLYGAIHSPASQAELDDRIRSIESRLVPSPVIFQFLDIMERVRIPFPMTRPVQRLMVRTAVELLPPSIRRTLDLERTGSLKEWQRGIVRRTAGLTDRIVLPSLPAVASCRRLGLPDDYLYRA